MRESTRRRGEAITRGRGIGRLLHHSPPPICGAISYINCPFLRYLSTLYSHPEWPNIHPRKVRDELRQNVKDNWMWLLLTPSWMYRHVNIILQKKSKGQPVSFTDFFGYLVGDTILKDVSLCSLFQALR